MAGCDIVGSIPGATDACKVVTDPGGAVHAAVGAALGSATNSVFGQFAEQVGQSAGDMLRTSMVWWVKSDSLNIDAAAIADVNKPLQGVFMLIMMVGVLTSALMMALSRRGQPAVELLMGAFKYVAISSLSLGVLSGALYASDEVSKQLITSGSDHFGDGVAKLLGIETLTNPATVLLLGILAFLLALTQWVFGFIRQAGILVLATMISIAAAGQLSTWGRQWFPRIASSLVALVLYKPMAALIYSTGFKFMGQGKDLATAVIGVMVIALAVIALPAMMKFFSFIGSHAPGGGGSGGGILAGAAGGAVVMSQYGGGGGSGSTATSHAAYMDSTGPGTGVSDTPPGPGGAATEQRSAGSGMTANVSGGEAPGDPTTTTEVAGAHAPGGLGGETAGAVATEGAATEGAATGAAATEGAAAAAGPAGVAIAAAGAAMDAVDGAAESATNEMTPDEHTNTNSDGGQ
jgi:type IV secretion system protein TrbL